MEQIPIGFIVDTDYFCLYCEDEVYERHIDVRRFQLLPEETASLFDDTEVIYTSDLGYGNSFTCCYCNEKLTPVK